MFDLITEKTERPFRKGGVLPRVLSTVLHGTVLALVVAIPLLTVTSALPEAPTMMAFVADMSAPPPPPPPPPPPAAPRAESKAATTHPTPSASALAAPVEAPSGIRPEPPSSATAGVVGGVEGGVEGGVVGGIVGGIVAGAVAPPPPPPPPPPPAPRGPVRIGGQIATPTLLHRVEPVYPDLGAAAHLKGLAILEAVVGADGCVESVKVLRSAHPLLDREAVLALKQWQYTPLVLNGIPTPFVLTVTFNFSVVNAS
jgi:protein TonB